MKNIPKTYYQIKGNQIEKRFDKLRNEIEKELRPIIKEKALSLKMDCHNTQYCFSLTEGNVWDYKNVDTFNDFLNRCADDFNIEFLFEIENGKFKWYR